MNLIAVIALLVMSPLFLAVGQSQSQDHQLKTVIDSFKAVASPYNKAALKNRDPERVGRSARYDEHAPGAPQIWEDSPAELLSLTNHVTRPAIPLASSDAIVVGTVTTASSYLSNDQKNIYSEFQITLQEVVKTPNALVLSPGQAIVVEHLGGAVQLPSGKVVVRGAADAPPPTVGKRYVLFLKYLESTRDFAIENGYLLEGQTVQYLDDCFTGELAPSMFDPSGKTPHAVTHRAGSQYAGTELQLLKQIRHAMAAERKETSKNALLILSAPTPFSCCHCRSFRHSAYQLCQVMASQRLAAGLMMYS
jgi:hypothetical protein